MRVITISEDNHRRYANMTETQIKEQTRKANEGIRELFKNPQWKENQIKKLQIAKKSIDARKKPQIFYSPYIVFNYNSTKNYCAG